MLKLILALTFLSSAALADITTTCKLPDFNGSVEMSTEKSIFYMKSTLTIDGEDVPMIPTRQYCLMQGGSGHLNSSVFCVFTNNDYRYEASAVLDGNYKVSKVLVVRWDADSDNRASTTSTDCQ